MAVKTFTTGEVLTASDTNTYLNNGGLVYITQTSATSGSSLSVDNVFSSTYSNYRILIDGYQPATGGTALYLRMRVGGADANGNDYYGALVGTYVDASSSNIQANGVSYMVTGIYNSATTIAIGQCSMDVFGPNRTERTFFGITATLYNTQFGGRAGFGEHNLTTAYTGFTLYPSSGNFSNFRVWVYGYLNS